MYVKYKKVMYVKIKRNDFKINTLLSCVYVNSAYDKQINMYLV